MNAAQLTSEKQATPHSSAERNFPDFSLTNDEDTAVARIKSVAASSVEKLEAKKSDKSYNIPNFSQGGKG